MNKLQLKDVRRQFKFTINKGVSFDGIELINSKHPLNMDFEVYLPSIGMNLQRPLCWSLNQKQEFIMSILKGNPIPKISMICHKENGNEYLTAKWEVIDGKQRLSTYISFCKGEFPLKSGHFMDDLDNDCKKEIFGFYFYMDKAYSYWDMPISDADKIAWFAQINFTCTPQDEQHLLKLTGIL